MAKKKATKKLRKSKKMQPTKTLRESWSWGAGS